MALKLFRLSGLLLIVFVHQGFCAVEKNLVCNDLDCSPQTACACVSDDVTIPWNIPNYASDIFSVSWTLENATSSVKPILSQSLSAPPSIVDSFNVVHNGQGSITLKSVTTAENTGIYRCDVNYNLGAGSPVTGTVTISVYDAPADLAFTTVSETEYQCNAGNAGSPATSLDIWVNNANQNSDKATVKKSDKVECCRSGKAVRCMSGVSTGCTSTKKCVLVQKPTPGPGCWCWWGVYYDTDGDLVIIVICWIVFLPTLALILYMVGMIIGVILTKTRCCCRRFHHCDDSDCFECCRCCGKNKCVNCACCASLPCEVCCNIAGLPFWVQVLWCSIIGTPVALGIYTVWICCGRGNGNVDAKCEDPKPETQSGNPRTGQKKSEIKNKSKISAQTENEQHNQGRKPREQPAIPLVAQTTDTPMSGREDSDSAVSREHVKLQDSDRTLPLRPMPDIPRKSDRQGHDGKGRGLSANFSDDDHPLVSIDIPLQKKGALDALPEGTGGEEPVKKKKKKKKKQEEDEE